MKQHFFLQLHLELHKVCSISQLPVYITFKYVEVIIVYTCIKNDITVMAGVIIFTGHTDYEPATEVLSFPEGATQHSFTARIINNFVVEDTETFTVEISLPELSDGVQLGNIVSTEITIIDDDIVFYSMEFYFCTCANYNEGTGATGGLSVIVRKSGYNDIPVAVHFTTQDGTAQGIQ